MADPVVIAATVNEGFNNIYVGYGCRYNSIPAPPRHYCFADLSLPLSQRMATEHSTSRALLQQAIEHSFDEVNSSPGVDTKRFGVFFPPGVGLPPLRDPTIARNRGKSEDDYTESPSSDNFSTWEFYAPQPIHISRRHSTASYGTKPSTPAQELASRYRAGMPLHTILASTAESSSRAKYNEPAVREEDQGEYSNGPRLHYRLSRVEALEDTVGGWTLCEQPISDRLNHSVRRQTGTWRIRASQRAVLYNAVALTAQTSCEIFTL